MQIEGRCEFGIGK